MFIHSLFLFFLATARAETDFTQELRDYQLTCFYNLQGEIKNEVKVYLKLNSPEKIAYITTDEEKPRFIESELQVKLPATCTAMPCEGLILLGFEEKFNFIKNTTIDDRTYFQIKNGHREKYLCVRGIE